MHHTPIKTIGCETDVIEISSLKKLAAINDVKTCHHLITLQMLIGVPIQQRSVYKDGIGLQCNWSYG